MSSLQTMTNNINTPTTSNSCLLFNVESLDREDVGDRKWKEKRRTKAYESYKRRHVVKKSQNHLLYAYIHDPLPVVVEVHNFAYQHHNQHQNQQSLRMLDCEP